VKSYECVHGLDLRKHPRCYLCKPLEFYEGEHGIVIKLYTPPIGSGSSTPISWCSKCGGWHTPSIGCGNTTYTVMHS
jgi:hypothetical protein